MPKKQNGFGNPKSFSIKGINKIVNQGKRKQQSGFYPSDRHYGSSVTRSIIQKWDLDSTWTRWRKGLEYYYRGAYLELNKLSSKLHQGTPYEIPLSLTGYKFATKDADTRSHYVIKREPTTKTTYAIIEKIYNNPTLHLDKFRKNEIYTEVKHKTIEDGIVIQKSIGETVVNKKGVSANITNVLTSDGRPSVYIGKSLEKSVNVKVILNAEELLKIDLIKKEGINTLINKIIFIPNITIERIKKKSDKFQDYAYTFNVNIENDISRTEIEILEKGDELSLSLNDITQLKKLYASTADIIINGSFEFLKENYQSFWGKEYVNAESVRNEISLLSYDILPFMVEFIKHDEENNTIELSASALNSALNLYSKLNNKSKIVFADNSFTKISNNTENEGWQDFDIDIKPWEDPTFVSGDELTIATIYACSCPAYSHAKIRNPEQYDDKGNKRNIQSRAPAPTAGGSNSYENKGVLDLASVIDSWATKKYKRGFKICKHTIAARYADNIKTLEPNSVPSYETRLKFEEKLTSEIEEVGDEFKAQLRRSDVSILDIVLALSESLNFNLNKLASLFKSAMVGDRIN